MLLGSFGSGASSALTAIALDAATTYRPDDIYFTAIDGDDEHQSLAPLRALLHCRSVTSSADIEGCRTVITTMSDELASRKAHPEAAATAPISLLLIDNVAPLMRSLQAAEFGHDVLRQLDVLLTDGPDVGIVAAISARREASLTEVMRNACPLRILLRGDDDALFHQLGVREHAIPTFVPGRGMLFPGGLEAQLVCPPVDLASALAKRSVTDLALP